MAMVRDVETFFTDGCGRCSFFATPQCKAVHFRNELLAIRSILNETGLVETSKWGMPCYMHNKKNVVMLAAFKSHVALLFFKGALMQDEMKLLYQPSENTQHGRQMRFSDVVSIQSHTSDILAYIFEAIEIEKSGVKMEKSSMEMPYPPELVDMFDKYPDLEEAFQRLTPGRRRAYLLHFTSAKHAKTRISRIEKYIQSILSGKGMHD